MMYAQAVEPIGAWMRLLARFIDSIVMIGVAVFMIFIMAGMLGASDISDITSASFGLTVIIFAIIIILSVFMYKPVMESSSLQATLGKLAIGAKVIDENGARISFGQAFYRFFMIDIIPGIFSFVIGIIIVAAESSELSIVSTLFGIGYAIGIGVSIGANNMKQGFHDRAAGTMVVRR